jgi:hypothetical protein
MTSRIIRAQRKIIPGSSGVLWRANEPPGMTFIDERPFNTLDEKDLTTPFWFRDNSSTIISDPTAPHSPPNVLRGTVAAGSAGTGIFSTGVEGQGISYRTLYICLLARYAPNWWGHLTGVNKITYFAANGSAGQCFIEANAVGLAPMTCQMVLQSGFSTDATFPSNINPSARITRGNWFQTEILATGNTAGGNNGTYDWFLDAEHIGSATGLNITDTAACQFDRLDFNPFWGGSGDSAPYDLNFDCDCVYLSGKN